MSESILSIDTRFLSNTVVALNPQFRAMLPATLPYDALRAVIQSESSASGAAETTLKLKSIPVVDYASYYYTEKAALRLSSEHTSYKAQSIFGIPSESIGKRYRSGEEATLNALPLGGNTINLVRSNPFVDKTATTMLEKMAEKLGALKLEAQSVSPIIQSEQIPLINKAHGNVCMGDVINMTRAKQINASVIETMTASIPKDLLQFAFTRKAPVVSYGTVFYDVNENLIPIQVDRQGRKKPDKNKASDDRLKIKTSLF